MECVNKSKFGILGFIVTMVFLPSFCFASGDSDDLEAWTTFGFSWKMSQKWRLTFDEALRFNDDASNFYYSHSEVGLVHMGVLKDLDLGLSYRSVFDHDDDNGNQEHRTSLNAFWKGKLFDAGILNRTKLEYRNLKDKDDVWRLRHRILFNKPFEKHAPEFAKSLREGGTFYFGDEIFIDFDGEDFNRNRVILGYQFELVKNTTADIHYYWQMDKDGSTWDGTHILGLSIRYHF